MAYAELDIINLAFQRLGVQPIDATEWATPTESKTEAATNAYQYIRDEVLEARDWWFAKSRTVLSKIPPQVVLPCGDGKILYVKADKWLEDTEDISIELVSNSSDALSVAEDSGDSTNVIISLANTTGSKNTAALIQVALRALTTVNGVSVASWTVTANTEYTAAPATADVDLNAVDMRSGPYGTYQYGYKIPSGFLRPVKAKPDDRPVDPTGAAATIFTESGILSYRSSGIYPYGFETLEDNTKILVTDYEATESYPLELVYIKQVTDVTKWSAHFINAVSFRLAAELSFSLPESTQKFDLMIKLYDFWLKRATAFDKSFDYVRDETGSESWDIAGRS